MEIYASIYLCNLHIDMIAYICYHIVAETTKPHRRHQTMYSYEVTYETMDGSHSTINISSTNLIKAAQFAESFLSIRVKDYRGLVEVKEHIYD